MTKIDNLRDHNVNDTGSSNRFKPLPIPVPWVFILAFVVGLAPYYLMPIEVHGNAAVAASRIAGTVLFAAGASVAVWSLLIFHSLRTTTSPLKASSTMVTRGSYRFSRNPMYVSLILMYIGEAGILAQLWPLVLLLPVVAYLSWIVIPHEEEQLRREFGDAYCQYRATVRRWL